MAQAITPQTPWYVGMTYPSVAIPLNTDSAPDNVDGMDASKFSVIIKNLDSGGTDLIGQGTIVVFSTNPAILFYTFDPADVATAGNCTLQVSAIFPSGGTTYYDPIPFYIKAV